MELSDINENTSKEQVLLLKYMTILFLLVSFLSILGLFLLSKIYWKDASTADMQKSSISQKHLANVTKSDNAINTATYQLLSIPATNFA